MKRRREEKIFGGVGGPLVMTILFITVKKGKVLHILHFLDYPLVFSGNCKLKV